MQKQIPAILSLSLTLAFLGSGCGDHEFHPPDQEERIASAEVRYRPETFDTISWESREERLLAGNIVYSTSCRRCHGMLGYGETDYAQERELEVPSLVEPEWPLLDSIGALRRVIFTGHQGGMPTFYLRGLPPRDIDAVAGYILYQLRPEVLGGETGAARPRPSS